MKKIIMTAASLLIAAMAFAQVQVGAGYLQQSNESKSGDNTSNSKLIMPNQALVDIVGTDGDHLNYWFAVTCDLESFGFKDSKAWFSFLDEWKKELASPALIDITK